MSISPFHGQRRPWASGLTPHIQSAGQAPFWWSWNLTRMRTFPCAIWEMAGPNLFSMPPVTQGCLSLSGPSFFTPRIVTWPSRTKTRSGRVDMWRFQSEPPVLQRCHTFVSSSVPLNSSDHLSFQPGPASASAESDRGQPPANAQVESASAPTRRERTVFSLFFICDPCLVWLKLPESHFIG